MGVALLNTVALSAESNATTLVNSISSLTFNFAEKQLSDHGIFLLSRRHEFSMNPFLYCVFSPGMHHWAVDMSRITN